MPSHRRILGSYGGATDRLIRPDSVYVGPHPTGFTPVIAADLAAHTAHSFCRTCAWHRHHNKAPLDALRQRNMLHLTAPAKEPVPSLCRHAPDSQDGSNNQTPPTRLCLVALDRQKLNRVQPAKVQETLLSWKVLQLPLQQLRQQQHHSK